jgi:DNA polymerase I
MAFTIDFLGDGAPLAWSLTGTDADPRWSVERATDYQPSLFAVTAAGMQQAAPDAGECVDALRDLHADLADHPAVASTGIESWQPGWRLAEQPVLRIAVDRVDAVRDVAQFVERRGPPGQAPFRAMDVDFTPEFRFCLDREVCPRPARQPRALRLDLPRPAASREDLTALDVAATTVRPGEDPPAMEPAGTTTAAVLQTVADRLAATDPDVLLVERAQVVPLVAEAAAEHGIDVGLAREPPSGAGGVPEYQQLAGASTYESYGQRHHSPARYTVPGRAIVDRSNTFFYGQSGLAGCLDMVERSWKPLQEASWASIGNVLTAIQIRAARDRGVLVQWRPWRPERFKTAAQLHAGDRGGTTLSPAVGFHEDVHELDFASLYPNIICEFGLSPETVRCRCCDTTDVPELDYSVCEQAGYLPDVLQPLVDDRAAIKDRLAAGDCSPVERDRLESRADAIKWILVSCFGYQGHANAKFGRIEVHEAINAYARDILLTAKNRLEAGGWRVLHGIVDSLWVTPREDASSRTPLDELADTITGRVGIELEYETAFDWVAFCPTRDGDAGALTKYFGRAADGAFKLRGIEARQRSTPPFVETVQRECIDRLDATRSPVAVLDRLERAIDALHHGAVSPDRLVERNRVSKSLEAYTQATRNVAALQRARDQGIDVHAGQDVEYVVVDDGKSSQDRVALAHEAIDDYDPSYYETRLVRAVESVLSPLGWDRTDIREALGDSRRSDLAGAEWG